METMPDEGENVRDTRFLIGSVALAVFWLAGSLAGFFFGVGYGLIGMAACSLTVAYLLGSSA